MQTQIANSNTETQFSNFKKAAIQKGQLIHIKGGDGDTPSDDGIIGTEDIITG